MNELQSLPDQIARLHAGWVVAWHENKTPPGSGLPLSLIEKNHRENFDLWHEEDMARRDDLGAEAVRQAKRGIDRFNQARNDAIEKLDEWFLSQLPGMELSSPLHSETPGMIVDRLSIMSLKMFHMKIEATRETADEVHRQKCAEKLARVQEQSADLKDCLHELIGQFQAGTRRFKIYRQMKMYNDASMNPQIYAQTS